MFKLRGELSSSQSILLGLVGLALLILIWWGIAESKSVQFPIVEGDKLEYPSAIGADAATLAVIDSLATVDSIRLANATEFKKVYPIIPNP